MNKMLNSSTHQMVLEKEHEGTEERYCPICGRRFLIEWNPWKRVIITKGDSNVSHSGGKGGLIMGRVEVEN